MRGPCSPYGKLLAELCVAACLGLLFAVSAASTPSVFASGTVSIPIAVTVANAGPASVGTLSGCHVSPGTISFDGVTHTVSADPSCTITLTVPADGPVSRYRFGPLSSVLIRTCGSGICGTANEEVFSELLNNYTVVAAAQPTFDALMTYTAKGTLGSVSNVPLCVITTQLGPSYSCAGWSDYGTTVVLPATPFGQAFGTRWEYTAARNFTDTTGGNVHTVVYYKQVREYASYVVFTPRGAGYTPPVFSYVSFGSPVQYNATGRASLKWVDYGSAWSITNPLHGSAAAQRWSANSVTGGTMTTWGRIRPSYYHQFNETFAYSVSDATTPHGPVVSYRSYALGATKYVPRSGVSEWANAASLGKFPGALNDSTSTIRWATPRLVYRVLGAAVLNSSYFHQSLVTLGYSTSDLSNITSGTVLGSYFAMGNPSHFILSNGTGGAAPSKAWIDEGIHKLQYQTALSPSSNERWALATSPDLKNVTSSAALRENGYVHQLGLAFSYALVGGGNPLPPGLNCTSLGSPVARNLTLAVHTYFCDKGGTWSVGPPILSGSGVSARWETTSLLSGPVNGTITKVFQYQHQVLMVFAFTVVDGGNPANPSVVYYQFGAASGASATPSGVSVWADVGSSYAYSNPSADSNGLERWASATAATGTVTVAATVNPSYYHQYLDVLQYTVSGGSPGAPLVSFTKFGSAATQHAALDTSSEAWIDAGTTVTYPASITDGMSTWTTATTTFTSALSATFDPTYS